MAVRLLEELEEEILVRLPAKSLMRFKSVKRSWNALVKTNSFVKRHSESNRKRSSHEQFMIFDNDPLEEDFNRISLLSSTNHVLEELPAAQHPFGRRSHTIDVSFSPMDHCNGILFLICSFDNDYYNDDCTNHHDIIMWNPTTREVKVVPPSSFPHESRESSFGCFGYASDDSNVLKIINVYTDFNRANATHLPLGSAEIYNSGTNSWSWLRDVHPLANFWISVERLELEGASVNGVSYWLFFDSNPNSILSFDFNSNQFQNLDPPTPRFGTLLAVGGGYSLAYMLTHCLSEDYEPDKRIEIWILNQQDTTWTKIANIQPIPYCFQICGIWNDFAEFLAYSDKKQLLVSYDSNAHPLRQFQVHAARCAWVEMVPYVETIAPISF